jgi:pimeloyl-ACP methyl ester carboxylesterase
VCGNKENKPLVLLHAASCGATIWYPNVEALSKDHCVYAIDLITESSKSILTKKIRTPQESALWLNEVFDKLKLEQIDLCGLSIGGWNAANYAYYYPKRVEKLILLSPIQTLSKMHPTFFIKIMRMGFHPTRANVEKYIGWSGAQESSLPESIIKQFTISVMNVNANSVFPKWIKESSLKTLNMPVLVLLGEREFAYSVHKALERAQRMISDLRIEVIDNASHLLNICAPDIINNKILAFLQSRH